MTNEPLKPCPVPWCDGTGIIARGRRFYVECDTCMVLTPGWTDTPEEAAAIWNERSGVTEAERAVVEAAKAEYVTRSQYGDITAGTTDRLTFGWADVCVKAAKVRTRNAVAVLIEAESTEQRAAQEAKERITD